MKNVMPQELEVWYLIPAIRKELAKVFISDYGLSQRKAAECLGITEAAISQYLKSKRGNEIKFSDEALSEIKRSARDVVERKDDITEKIYRLCVLLRKSKAMCAIHRLQDKRIPKECSICLKE